MANFVNQYKAQLLVVAGLALASPAFAADLPAHKAPPAAPPAFTWTGLYVGMNAGYTFAASDPINLSSVNLLDNTLLNFGSASALGATGTVRARLDGFFFGGQLGYNWQFSDRFILGVEADIQGAGVRGGNGQLSVWPAGPGFASTSFKANRQLEYLGTARARLGYAVTPTIMAYVTGGFAYGGTNMSGAVSQALRPSALTTDTAKGDHYDILTGWTAGAGAEMALSRNLSAKLEYLYYDLGELWLGNPSLSHRDVLLGTTPLIDATYAHTRFAGHLVRAGLNYRFDASIPETGGSAATPLLASPGFASVERPKYEGWRWLVMPYVWVINMNGGMKLQNQQLATDASFIDALTRSASFPLAFMGRVETSNGPFFAYGDLAWARMRFAGSTLSLRSPLGDFAVAATTSGRLRMTVTVGEAGFGYELARFKLMSAPASFTAFDAYAGLRYVNMGLNLDGNINFAGNSALLGIQQIGTRSVVGTGALWWIDPVIGMRMRHSFAPGSQFEARADIGGFGAGSKFSWQFYGGYTYDFQFNGVNLTGLIGYRALGMNFSKWVDGRENGINAVMHGPVTGVGMKF
ncbi:outer membrane protein [Methylocystis parvus]|uniref:outer membrane protein n=1 Tax=Methylocystis parvus TaxID=134 RepID=UPI003C7512A2